MLNISDFSRYSKSQRGQMIGQAIGLPVMMGLFGFMAIVVSACCPLIFGESISDPVQIVSRIGSQGGTSSTTAIPTTFLAMVGVILATLSTNIAANVVGPANALVAISPGKVSFATGALLTAVLGIVIMPWKLVASSSGFIFSWLIGYSALLGPIAGIMVADYFVIRRFSLDSDALFTVDKHAPYYYFHGYNLVALVSLLVGIVINLPGFMVQVGLIQMPSSTAPSLFSSHVLPFFMKIYEAAWFVGFAVGALIYTIATPIVSTMSVSQQQKES